MFTKFSAILKELLVTMPFFLRFYSWLCPNKSHKKQIDNWRSFPVFRYDFLDRFQDWSRNNVTKMSTNLCKWLNNMTSLKHFPSDIQKMQWFINADFPYYCSMVTWSYPYENCIFTKLYPSLKIRAKYISSISLHNPIKIELRNPTLYTTSTKREYFVSESDENPWYKDRLNLLCHSLEKLAFGIITNWFCSIL